MILVFYNNASDSIADDKCGLIQGEIDSMGEAISVYKINLSTVALPAGIRQKYLAGDDLVCCVSKSDSIKKRVVNPNQPEVMGLINSV